MITIGIDLGTTNSAVAYNDGHGSQIIETGSGAPTLPSVVGFESDGTLRVGAQALKRMVRRDPKFIFRSVKRHIGMPFVDGEDYGPQIVKGSDGMRWFQGPDRLWSPQELSAEILKSLKATAERRLGCKVDGAVITVPAYFDNNRIVATQEAGKLAGFRKVTALTEPEAAVLAYGLEREKFTRVAVVDLGGGTFDYVLADAGGGLIKLRGKGGDGELGGDDYDACITAHVVDRFLEETGQNLRDKPISMLKIPPVAEETKKDLSEIESTRIDIMNLALDHGKDLMVDISYDLTREAFEAMTAHWTGQAIAITKRVMEHADRLPNQVDDVLLVGGMTRVPAVRKAFGDYFGHDKLRDTVSADLVVAIGAAIKAAEIDGRLAARVATDDVTAHAFGVEIEGGRFVPVLAKGAKHGEIQSVRVTTAVNGQDTIPIAVLQGEDTKAARNVLLGRYAHPVTPAPAGTPTIELEFMVDESGLVLVAGKDLDTGETLEILGRQ